MSKVLIFRIIFGGLFVGLVLFAGTEAQALENEWSSSLDLKAISYPVSVSTAVNDQLYQGDLKLGLVSQGELFKFTGKLNYVADPGNNSVEEQNFFDLPEFNLKLKAGQFLFKAGTDIYNWGVTDAINPVDLVNAQAYYDPIHPRKLGAATLSASYSGESFDVDLVYTPWARPSLLPGQNSRWLPRQVYISPTAAGSNVELLIPSQFTYNYLPRGTLGSPNAGNTALRLQGHLENLDLALYGNDGIAPIPIFTPIATVTQLSFFPIPIYQALSNVQLRLQDYRQQTGGVSFVKTLNSWQIKGEAAWTQPSVEASSIVGWHENGVVGLEKTWAIGTTGSLVTELQYSSAAHSNPAGNSLLSFVDFFDSNWMLAGHFSWRDNDTVTFFYSFDVLSTSWLGDLSYSRRLTDNLTVSLGGTTMDGPNTSPLGVYAGNKSIYVQFGTSF